MQMLEDFVELSHGDVLVQNNANSAVGQVMSLQQRLLMSAVHHTSVV